MSDVRSVNPLPIGSIEAPEITCQMTVDEARRKRWEWGRKVYAGDAFVGDPLRELYAELLDALNYLDEYERQGMPQGCAVSAKCVALQLRYATETVRFMLTPPFEV